MTPPNKFIRQTENYWVLAEMESSSSPGKVYEVRTSKNDSKTYCNCPGWIFKARKGDGICKHIAKYQKEKPVEEVIVIYKLDEFLSVKRNIVLNLELGPTGINVSVRRK